MLALLPPNPNALHTASLYFSPDGMIGRIVEITFRITLNEIDGGMYRTGMQRHDGGIDGDLHRAYSPKNCLMARASTTSPSGVEVACALMYPPSPVVRRHPQSRLASQAQPNRQTGHIFWRRAAAAARNASCVNRSV